MFNASNVAVLLRPVRPLLWGVCLGLAFLISLSGCAAMNLNKLTITSMAASLPNGPSIAPGEKFPLSVTMTQPDGKVLSTAEEADGRISWKDLAVTASVVTVDKNGRVSLPADPRLSDGKLPHVIITVPSHPDLRAELDIPVSYDRKFSASFQGSSGFSGLDGASGRDGSTGSMGSFDPDHPAAGGNGEDGTNGSDGEDGKPGSDGPPVQVRAALRSGSHPLLQVGVFAQGKQKFFLVDPQGGFLVVTSEGGSGGSGGRGGRGGRGGSGGSGSPPGRSGSDGLSGHDGRSGWSGNGGSITVTYDPQVKPFLFAIRLSNPGGPRPAFKEEPVDPLW